MNRPVLLLALALAGWCLLAVAPAGPVRAASVEDCTSINIDSCDFSGLDSMCQELFSNPRPCGEICRSVSSGTDVGQCLICCQEVMPQLNMNQPKQIQLDD